MTVIVTDKGPLARFPPDKDILCNLDRSDNLLARSVSQLSTESGMVRERRKLTGDAPIAARSLRLAVSVLSATTSPDTSLGK